MRGPLVEVWSELQLEIQFLSNLKYWSFVFCELILKFFDNFALIKLSIRCWAVEFFYLLLMTKKIKQIEYSNSNDFLRAAEIYNSNSPESVVSG